MSCPTRYTDTAHELGLCNCPVKDTMEYTLVIYAQMPESVDMYLIPSKDLTQDDLDTLRVSQNVYVNSTKLSKRMMESTTRLIAAFCEKPEHLPDEHPAGDLWACRWAKFKVDPSEPILGPNITRVFTSGFVL